MYEKRNNKEYKTTNYFKGGKQKYKNILSMANVSNRIDINDDFVNDLSQGDNPLITILYKGLIILNFLDNCNQSGDIVFEVKNYEDIGWYFDYYNYVDKVKLCEYCGQPFKQVHGNELYCKKHKEYQPIETKTINCIDCGKEVFVDSKDNQTVRCDECYKVWRRDNVKENVRRFREKSKNVIRSN